jgi:hypothetical protein
MERIDMNRDEWLTAARGVSQELESSHRTPAACWCSWPRSQTARRRDNQILAALVRLEQANDRAAQARVAAAKLIQSSKRQSQRAERKARAIA